MNEKNGIQNGKMQTVQFVLECNQDISNTQGWVYMPLLLQQTKKQISKSLKKIARTSIKLGISYLVAYLFASLISLFIFNQNNYIAFTSGYLLVFAIFIATYLFLSPKRG